LGWFCSTWDWMVPLPKSKLQARLPDGSSAPCLAWFGRYNRRPFWRVAYRPRESLMSRIAAGGGTKARSLVVGGTPSPVVLRSTACERNRLTGPTRWRLGGDPRHRLIRALRHFLSRLHFWLARHGKPNQFLKDLSEQLRVERRITSNCAFQRSLPHPNLVPSMFPNSCSPERSPIVAGEFTVSAVCCCSTSVAARCELSRLRVRESSFPSFV
jgi:hypothetical protein